MGQSLKFAIGPKRWQPVIDALENDGHEEVQLSGGAELYIHNGKADEFPTLPESVKWVQFTLAGIDAFINAGLVEKGRRFSNASGIYAKPVAESAVAMLLAVLHLFPKIDRAKAWDQTGEIDRDTRWLYGKKVAIIGAGGIGRHALSMLSGFGCEGIAVNRSGDPVEGAARTVTDDHLIEVLEEADHVILAAPLTEKTNGMINKETLAHMKRDAILVNVGRGPLVKTDDLVEALQEGRIAGAALDVTDPEPLPADSPLWQMDNVLITPHVANTATQTPYLLADALVENARAYLSGERMPTEVEPGKGY